MGAREAGEIRVLHVDDEPNLAETAAALLERQDERLAVETATSASEARERIATTDFDCVVSDYDMPERNGLELLADVRTDHPDLPFILFTGKGSEEVASEAISAGVTDYLQKRTLGEQYELLAVRILNAVERYRSRRSLTERTRRLETLINNLPGIVYRARTDEGWPMEQVEGECETLTGYSTSALENGDVSWGEDIFHPDDLESVRETVREAIESGESFEVTYRIITADDATKWVWERGRQVRTTIEERTVFEGFITDITARKRRQKALEQLHEATRELMEATTTDEVAEVASETVTDVLHQPMNGVHLYDETDETLVPVAWADRSEAYLDGRPPELPVEGSLAGRVFRSGEAESVADLQEANGVYDPETPFRSELVVPLGDHGVLLIGSTTPDDFDSIDESLARILAANITTALGRVEREQELSRQNERLDDFANVVTHDLRNPLQVAQIRLEVAREDCDSDALSEVANAHDRIETLLDDLLTLAREGERVGETQTVALDVLADSCWSSVRTHDASLDVRTDRRIDADPSRVKQLLENLFDNAVEHGSTGSQKSEISDDAVEHGSTGNGTSSEETTDDSTVTVTVGDLDGGFYVADDGPGIPEDERDRVFEIGYSTASEGTGFGLNIVREVAHAHGWNVSVTDSETGGARFEVTGVDVVDE